MGKPVIKNLKPFQKGKSGNPKGRPKKIPEIDNLLKEVLGNKNDRGVNYAQAILNKLRFKALKGDVRAAEILLDRAYGKAKQVTEEIGGRVIKVTIVKNGGS